MAMLTAMRWTGGKSAASSTGTGRWIAGLLPAGELYVEPFAGMLGVLLQRPPSRQEIVNDLDGRVVNWWRVVRDSPDELARLLALTPKSRAEFERALADAETEPIRRALDFTIVCLQAVSGRQKTNCWTPTYSTVVPDWRRGLDARVALLAERMRNVQIEQRDAVDVLARLALEERAVVYVDPPYEGTVGYEAGVYAHVDDRGALLDVLRAQRGRVAVSGYGEEWDDLGWRRHEHGTHTPLGVVATNGKGRRTEVCWTNYAVDGPARLPI